MILILVVLNGCNEKTTVKPDSTVIIPKSLELEIDKSNPVKMYVNKKTLKVRAFDKSFKDWGADYKLKSYTNYPVKDTLFKYDRVTMYELRSNWAYVEGMIQDTLSSSNKMVSGWVASKYLKPWMKEKFFKVKENIFKLKRPVVLYANGIENKISGKIKSGSKIRVLRGNGDRLFVVSDSGDSGWIEPENIDTTKLVAKSFAYEKVKRITQKFTAKTISNGNEPIVLEFSPVDMLSDEFQRGEYEKVFKQGSSVISVNGKEYVLHERLKEINKELPPIQVEEG
ncbi:MAG: hypothetical protein D6707_06270, partial [Bacteroidetes bacterium]